MYRRELRVNKAGRLPGVVVTRMETGYLRTSATNRREVARAVAVMQ
jgi:hypothetical protein